MKKVVLFNFLMIFFTQYLAFSQQELDAKLLMERFKEVNSQVLDARIKLGEAIIKHLEDQGDYAQIERIKNIYRLATEYHNFCEGEQRTLFMYIYIKDEMKVFISAYLRDLLQKNKKELEISLKNISNYSQDLKDKNDLVIVTNLQNSIVGSQEVIRQLIEFYSSENAKYKEKIKYFE